MHVMPFYFQKLFYIFEIKVHFIQAFIEELDSATLFLDALFFEIFFIFNLFE